MGEVYGALQAIRARGQARKVLRTIGCRYNRGVGMTIENADAFEVKRNG